MSGIDKTNNISPITQQDYNSRTQAAANQETTVISFNSPAKKSDEFKQEDKLEILAKQIGVTKDELLAMVSASGVQDINSLTPEELYKAALQVVGEDEPVEEAQNNNVKTENNEVTENNNKENSLSYKEFSELSREDKTDVLFLELAKNKFLYGDADNKKNIKEWNALTEEQKQELVFELQVEGLNKVNKKTNGKVNDLSQLNEFVSDLFTDEMIEESLDKAYLVLTTATSCKKDIKSFSKLNSDEKADQLHSKLLETKESELSDSQKAYIKECDVLTAAIMHKKEKLGEQTYKEACFPPSQIKEQLAEYNMTPVQLELEYLEDKKAQGVTVDEKRLEDLHNMNAMDDALKSYSSKEAGQLKEFQNSELYAKTDFEHLGTQGKKAMLLKHIKQEYSNLKPEEFAQNVAGLLGDLRQDPQNSELVYKLLGDIYKSATPEQQKALAGLKDVNLQAANSVNVNELSDEHVEISAKAQEEMSSDLDNPEQAQVAANIQISRINISDDKHAKAASHIDAASKNENVQRAHANRAIEAKDVQIQNEMLTNTATLSSQDVRKETAVKLPNVHKDNQVDLAEKFMADKEVANTMNEAQILDKFHKDNQTEIFKSFQNRFEQDDYSKDEAINQLNILSDQISKCDKDNQLAMHENIMGSKYSEVQEHAAGNIKNYDSSVQSKALDAVYESGNKKAIEKAIENISSYKSNDVKSQELGRVFGEFSNQISSDLKEKFLGGRLTLQEISQLSASQRREYYTEMYKKATPAQKLQWLDRMPDGVHKKTIYKFIALYDNNLLTSMVEKGKGLEMFNLCNDVAAQNKIFSVMRKSENDDVKKQCEEIQHNPRNAGLFIGKNMEDEPKTANTVNYSSIPFSDKFELFKKQDKFGTFLQA